MRRPRVFASLVAVLAASLTCASFTSAADPIAHAAAYKLSGKSNQCAQDGGACNRVTIGLAASLTLVTRFAIDYEASCPSGLILHDTADVGALKTSIGKAQIKFASRGFSYDMPLADGSTGHFTGDITGKLFKNGKGTGAFDAAVTITDPDGNELEKCSSGTDWVTWTARTG